MQIKISVLVGWQWGTGSLRGLLTDGFYFHCQVGVKLSAESEDDRRGDKVGNRRGLTRTSRGTSGSPPGCHGNTSSVWVFSCSSVGVRGQKGS